MEIVRHFLTGSEVRYLNGSKSGRKLVGPEMVVLHYTAGTNTAGTSAAGAAAYLARPDTRVSAHVVVGRLGEIIQLTPFDLEAWHAGTSAYKGQTGLNRLSVGIELDNLGRLEERNGVFVAECGKVVDPREVYTHSDGSHWHRYTMAQVEAAREICRLLRENYPVRYVVGHADVTGRKQDPGPALAECGFDGYAY